MEGIYDNTLKKASKVVTIRRGITQSRINTKAEIKYVHISINSYNVRANIFTFNVLRVSNC